MADLTRAQRLKAIQEAYTAWEQRHERAVKPDPAIVKETNTQYPEGIVAVSATPRMDAELIAMIGEAATYPTDSTVASAFHLPGKHDQKTHGRQWPGRWKEVSLEQARTLAFKHYEQEYRTHGIARTIEPRLFEKSVDGYTFYRSGNNLVQVHADADINDDNLNHLMEGVDTLTYRFPVRGGVTVAVDSIDSMNGGKWDGSKDPLFAETWKSTGMMRFSDLSLNGNTAAAHMTQPYRGDQASAILAHEWGHTQGKFRGKEETKLRSDLFATLTPANSSEYARTAPEEAFADAFSDFNTTPIGEAYQWTSTPAYADAFYWSDLDIGGKS